MSESDAPVQYPDRIIRSGVNKFDILPEEQFLEIAREDGQDIVKLLSLGQLLLVFSFAKAF